MKNHSAVITASVLIFGAVGTAYGQKLPPVRQIGPATSMTSENLRAVSAVRQLSDGRVLVNDIIGRRVLLFDSTLKTFTVVADTTSATGTAYGPRAGGLIPFRGDSTLFVDPASLSMLVIDGNGKIARVMSAPRANDANFLVGGPFGTPGFDPQGRLVYRAPPRIEFGARGRPSGGAAAAPGGSRDAFTPPTIPDSAPLVRVDLATRKLDTLAFFKTPQMRMNVTREPEGGIRVLPTVNPLPTIDDWGILPDGTVALIRGRDYHIDWITPDKAITSTAKIPFEWQRLSDDAKVAYIDSTRKAFEEARARGDLSGMFGGAFGGAPMIRTAGPAGPAPAAAGSAGAAAGAPPGAGGAAATITTTENATVTRAPAGGNPFGGELPRLNFVEPSELPDYKPPFSGGATRVDAEGNLWIRTTHNLNGRPVYDVVNRKGDLIDRVQLPAGRVIAGFGAGGVIYLGYREGDVARLEKARVK